MFGTELYIALVIGVVLSLIYTERTGVMPAGLIVPGYLALVFDQPIFLVMVFFISFLTYIITMHVVGRLTVLYGRRKFAAMMTVGILLKMIFDYFYPIFPFETVEFRGLGVIVPGLIANSFQRQGVMPTLVSTLVLSGITFLIVSFLYFL
ncbi:poly-gamma-glutamate biosynthesis protein PgsC/CapC [Geomicrobium halophilum]|uniref:Poly-gamma-glutamate biosynthesis protein PgsC/CapC n=1 Tax=Geomicrobium halophilum TaxID=549000 RepID=A0A841PHM6_9BACL|nr:poly-gamma-glutamate biosynthesis protein PgsC [Geomicrobium halophilum]MBB6448387.1 poly-gamma-glutamate biosynthesis protein PgsC/CapC [Geomicrobium halophilum]